MSGTRLTTPSAAILLTLVLAALTVSGCTSHYYVINSYEVNVTGLSDYTSNGGATIDVPMPVADGKPVYTTEQIGGGSFIYPPPISVFADYRTVNVSKLVNNTDWTATTGVSGRDGDFIGLSTSNSSLTDFIYQVSDSREVPSAEYNETYARFERSIDYPMAPANGMPQGNYTVPVSGALRNYSAYVDLNYNLTPVPGKETGNILIEIHYSMLTTPNGNTGVETHEYFIRESIPSNVTGRIPVTVQQIS